MSIVAAALRALLNDPNMSVAATLTRKDGSTATVDALRRAPDEVQEVFSGRVQSETNVIEVMAVDVDPIEEGDTFAIEGENFIITAPPRRDRDGIFLTIELARMP